MSRPCSAAKNSLACFYLTRCWSVRVCVSPACKWELWGGRVGCQPTLLAPAVHPPPPGDTVNEGSVGAPGAQNKGPGCPEEGKGREKRANLKGMLSLLAQREAACPLPQGSTEPGRRLGCREGEAEEEGG